MITIKTASFEATVTPFFELPIVKQFPAHVASLSDPHHLFVAITPIFREQLSPDKLDEFDNLNTEQTLEALVQFTAPQGKLAFDCEHGHRTAEICAAYGKGFDAGQFAAVKTLFEPAFKMPGRRGRIIRNYLLKGK